MFSRFNDLTPKAFGAVCWQAIQLSNHRRLGGWRIPLAPPASNLSAVEYECHGKDDPKEIPAAATAQRQQTPAADPDRTLSAMQDELDRARARLELKIPDRPDPARPYYIQYRILDLDIIFAGDFF